MSEPLAQAIEYALALLVGGGVVGGGVTIRTRWQRRNGRASADAERIVTAIEASADKVSAEIQTLGRKTDGMHRDVSRLLGRSEGGGG